MTPFAAGCAICGADLDIRRFDRPQRRYPWHRWILRVAIVGVVALLCYLAATGGDGPSPQKPPAARAKPGEAPAPHDARRVIDRAVGGASPAAQRTALRRYLSARGIPTTSIAAVMRHSRDGIGLAASRRATGTRIGGPGLVPSGQDWPRSPAGYPLDFIALIDFAQLPHLAPLPRAGRLALYFGGNPDDPRFLDPLASARVYYFPPGARTASPRAPRDIFPVTAVHLGGHPMSFSGDAEQVVADAGDGPARDKLIDAMNDVTTRALQPSHLLGMAFAVQGPPLEELVHHLRSANGQATGDYSRAERRDPRRWLLLAQIEEQGELTIADGGVLFYAIPRRDLAAGRFDRVAVIMQSH